MTDVLIRGLSPAAVEKLERSAKELGLSRNEYLRRRLEGVSLEETATVPRPITDADWARSAAIFADLSNPAVMDGAWK